VPKKEIPSLPIFGELPHRDWVAPMAVLGELSEQPLEPRKQQSGPLNVERLLRPNLPPTLKYARDQEVLEDQFKMKK